MDKAPQYLTAKVERGNIEDEVLAVGILQAFRQVDIGASGKLKELDVKLGDAVKAGQRLAEIDPILLQNALKVAEATKENLQAQRRAAEAQLRQAEFTYHSQEQMLSDEATPHQDFETVRAQLEAQRANLASLDAQIKEAGIQVETAKANLSFTRITARWMARSSRS
ncbi:MAG: Macrolide-specific efflux protein MacA [uncultured Caballeronia sp.]|nr:MAG: Macrolide-specific efflux protein MacA [uncultured Caballeronia sp.]